MWSSLGWYLFFVRIAEFTNCARMNEFLRHACLSLARIRLRILYLLSVPRLSLWNPNGFVLFSQRRAAERRRTWWRSWKITTVVLVYLAGGHAIEGIQRGLSSEQPRSGRGAFSVTALLADQSASVSNVVIIVMPARHSGRRAIAIGVMYARIPTAFVFKPAGWWSVQNRRSTGVMAAARLTRMVVRVTVQHGREGIREPAHSIG